MSSLASQITPLILVVDLEATCCDQGSITANEMEIIEIGACWASEDGVVLDTFECFVRPTRRPVLTSFCKELLGISQDQVDSAEALTNVAPKFERFVRQRLADAVAWGSWGAYDRNQLERECARLGVAHPVNLPHQNLKQCFAKAQRIGKQVGMRKALEMASMPLEGQHHRALDDALNISRLLPWAIGPNRITVRWGTS